MTFYGNYKTIHDYAIKNKLGPFVLLSGPRKGSIVHVVSTGKAVQYGTVLLRDITLDNSQFEVAAENSPSAVPLSLIPTFSEERNEMVMTYYFKETAQPRDKESIKRLIKNYYSEEHYAYA